MLNAAQFRTAVLATNDTSLINQLGSSNTDWFSLIDRTAIGQQHDVVISGVGQSNDYHLSVGYLNQDGIIGGSNTQRVSLGFNYQQRLFNDRLNVRTNLKGSRAFDRFTPGGVLSNAAQMGPTQPAFDQNSPTGYYNWPGNKLQSADNPLQILNLAKAQGTTYRSVGNLQATYSLPFMEGLKANMNIGYDITNVSQVTFNPSTLHSEQKSGENGYFYRTDPNMTNTVLETYLNLARPLNFAPGTIDVTAGYSYTQSHAEYPTLTLTGLSTNVFDINGFPTALNTSPGGPNIQESKLISFFGRVNYNLNDRYLAAVSLRRDGSSRFGPSNAWGTFPSVAVAWRLSQEPFLRNMTVLSDLKLRASWAKTGNQAFANYQQYTAYLAGNQQAQVQFGNVFVPSMRPSAVDPNIKWEQTARYERRHRLRLLEPAVQRRHRLVLEEDQRPDLHGPRRRRHQLLELRHHQHRLHEEHGRRVQPQRAHAAGWLARPELDGRLHRRPQLERADEHQPPTARSRSWSAGSPAAWAPRFRCSSRASRSTRSSYASRRTTTGNRSRGTTSARPPATSSRAAAVRTCGRSMTRRRSGSWGIRPT